MYFKELRQKKEYIVIFAVIVAILFLLVIAVVIILLTKKSDDFLFTEQCLKAHNEYRSQHGSPALRIDSKLISVALKVAKSNAEKGILEHSKYGFGENLYEIQSSSGFEDFKCERAVTMWYDEYKDYDFQNGNYALGIGHFTQLVWKNSKSLGCASAKSNNLLVVACEYEPPGNVIGSFKENVQPKM